MIIILIALLFGIIGAGLAITFHIFAGQNIGNFNKWWPPFLIQNSISFPLAILLDVIILGVPFAALSLLVGFPVAKAIDKKKNKQYYEAVETNKKVENNKAMKKKIFNEKYKAKVDALVEKYHVLKRNAKQDYIDKVNKILDDYEKQQESIYEWIGQFKKQMEKSFEKSIIPISDLMDPSSVEIMMTLLITKRANNLTDLLNLCDTTVWRGEVLSSIQQGFNSLYNSNQTIIKKLDTTNERINAVVKNSQLLINQTETIMEKINNFKIDVDVSTDVYIYQ